MSRVVPGSIMLFHNDGAHTPEVLPTLIEKLQEKGYSFLKVSELVDEGLETARIQQ